MSQFNVSQLRDLRNRPVVTEKPIFAKDHEAWRNDVEARIANLNDFLQARAGNHSGASAPASFIGMIWANTGNTNRVVFTGSPFGATGFTDEFATRLEAYRLSFGTKGTAVFAARGVFTRDVAGTSGTTDLTLTVPASTLNTDGEVLTSFAGIVTGVGGWQALVKFAGATASLDTLTVSLAAIIETTIFRVGANSVKVFSAEQQAVDSAGGTGYVKYATGTDSLTASATLLFDVQALSTGNLHVATAALS